jgi:thiosulfate/3-mercaptopyruvate sulfurtransferase
MKISKMGWSAALLALLVIMDVSVSNAGTECALCKAAENWDNTANSFLTGNSTEQTLPSTANPQMSRANIWGLKTNSILTDNSTEKTSLSTSTPQQSRASDPNTNSAAPQRSSSIQEMLAPFSSVMSATGASSTKPSSYDVILDVSPEATEYIQGAISIPYSEFMNNGSLKPVSEVAKILGDAGISERDSVLVYGQCLPCGVNSAYVYWVLKYLGHDNAKILDGGIDNWVAAKLPTETVPKVLPKVTFTPKLNPGLLATYDYVKNGKVQIVDARSFQEFGLGYIPKALNIPYDQVMDNGQLKSEAELRDLFSSIDKTLPVVVYSDTGAQAGSVWFALETLGYNASLYSWQDWMANQPGLPQLEDIRADPNPATQGSPIKITALFGVAKKIANPSSTVTGNSTNKTILTIKGCATCGFGSPQGFANINKSSGVAQLGNSGQTTTLSQAGSFTCTATVIDSTGSTVGRVAMKQIAGDEYSGIWNANVGPGSYQVAIVVSASGITKTFDNALEIKIVGTEKDTSKYKKVGN